MAAREAWWVVRAVMTVVEAMRAVKRAVTMAAEVVSTAAVPMVVKVAKEVPTEEA